MRERGLLETRAVDGVECTHAISEAAGLELSLSCQPREVTKVVDELARNQIEGPRRRARQPESWQWPSQPVLNPDGEVDPAWRRSCQCALHHAACV
jgi:hypothetical protein